MNLPINGSEMAARADRREYGWRPIRPGGPASLIAILAAVTVGLAACSGSSSPRVASAGTSSANATSGSSAAIGGGAAGSSSAGPLDVQSALLAYATCMRADGVPNFPDPSGGGFQVSAGIDRSSPTFTAAQAKCQKLLPGGGLGPGSGPPPSAQALAHMLTVSQCMRRHGIVDFPDPMTSVPPHPFGGGTGVISDIDGVILVFPDTIDQESPAFAQAAAACGFPLHNH